MPRVKSVFEVAGVIDGFAETPLRIKLAVIKGGFLVGRVTTETPSCTEFVLVDGKYNLDFFASTENHQVYSCQFSLIKYDDADATIVDCAARISKAHGLVGRWNDHGSLGKKGVCDHAFEMKSVRAEKTGIVEATAETAVAFSTEAKVGEPRDLMMRGDAVDQNGYVYTTTLQATLHADGSVMGVLTETGKRCKLAGSWSGNNVSYTINYPLGDRMTQYSYRGVLTANANGGETLSGTWKYEKQSDDENELFGGFEFCSHENSAVELTMSPGEYVFTGAATSDSGTKYDAKVTLDLKADGTLTGKSEELSIAPQVCDLTGSWDLTDKSITYRMVYTNGGTGNYEYVGRLHDQQLIGRWVNPRAVDSESERGDFAFSLSSFQASVEKAMEAVVAEACESASNEMTAGLVPGEYVLLGAATSDDGTKYDAQVSLTLAADGTLTGISKELSIAPQECKLTGTWDRTEQKITYTMSYTNGCTASYEYTGQIHEQELTGRWTNTRVSSYDGERGDFTFRVTSFTAFAIQVVEATETTEATSVKEKESRL